MNDLTSYRLQDFIPFTAEVYFRLLERMNETFWPLHLLTLAIGAAMFILASRHHTRLACLLPAPLWVFVAIAFFLQRYASLNWAGDYAGYAFIAQAVLLVAIALSRFGLEQAPRCAHPPVFIGVAITLFGLIILPLTTPLTGDPWSRVEVFGIHADPTAITTLGLALILLRSWALWIATLIPALWLLISGLTLQVLLAPGAVASGEIVPGAVVPSAAALFVILAVALVGLVWKTFEPESATEADN